MVDVPAMTENHAPLTLSRVASLPQVDRKSLLTLQYNLWNGWMDKFRTANTNSTDAALTFIQNPLDLWSVRHLRTRLTRGCPLFVVKFWQKLFGIIQVPAVPGTSTHEQHACKQHTQIDKSPCSDEISEGDQSEGLSDKVLLDLQRFLCCHFLLANSSGSHTATTDDIKLMQVGVIHAPNCSARCNLLFRSNTRLRSPGPCLRLKLILLLLS